MNIENELITVILNLLYHIMDKVKGDDAVQVFVFLNFIWVIVLFFVVKRYHKIIERMIEIIESQNVILSKIEELVKEKELIEPYRADLNRLLEENKQLKISNLQHSELIKFLKK